MSRDWAASIKLRATFWTCFLFFIAGFCVWYKAELNREASSPYRRLDVSRSGWNPGMIFKPTNHIRVPFPRAVVTDILGGDSFVFSTGKKVRLVGVSMDAQDEAVAREAAGLVERLVGKRQVFFEHEPDYGKGGEGEYVYLYFMIPIIPSDPPVGPEYVHWSLNAELLKLGYARLDESVPFRFLEKFRAYQNEARNQRKGLWRNL